MGRSIPPSQCQKIGKNKLSVSHGNFKRKRRSEYKTPRLMVRGFALGDRGRSGKVRSRGQSFTIGKNDAVTY